LIPSQRKNALAGERFVAEARWEKGQTDVAGPADRLIRVLYREHIGGSREVRRLIDALAELDETEHGRRCFEESADGWRTAA